MPCTFRKKKKTYFVKLFDWKNHLCSEGSRIYTFWKVGLIIIRDWNPSQTGTSVVILTKEIPIRAFMKPSSGRQ